MDKLLLIAGPTAGGKTNLGLALSRQFNGEIISADSRQVFEGMDIGTGKDIPGDSRLINKNSRFKVIDPNLTVGYRKKEGIPIWLTDVVKADYSFHVSLYRKLALSVIADIHKRHKLPVVVGGTGLYLKSLLTEMPDIEIRPDPEVRDNLKNKKAAELADILKTLDNKHWSSMNESDRQNPRRLIRAIELVGKKSSGKKKFPQFDFLLIYLTAPKKYIFTRIEKRIKERLKSGVIEETENLLKAGFDFPLPSFSASPYRQLKEFFENGKTKELLIKAIAGWKHAEVNYAKRQMVWFKKMIRQLSKKGQVLKVDVTQNYQHKLDRQIKEWYTSGNQ